MKNKDEEIVGDILKVRMTKKYLKKFTLINEIKMFNRKGELKITFTKNIEGEKTNKVFDTYDKSREALVKEAIQRMEEKTK